MFKFNLYKHTNIRNQFKDAEYLIVLNIVLTVLYKYSSPKNEY